MAINCGHNTTYTCTTSYQKHESPTHQVQAFLLCEKGPVQYPFYYCFVVVFCYDLTTPILLWPLEEQMIWNHGNFGCWGGNTQFAPLSILGLSWDRRWECMAGLSWVKMSQGCQGQADGESVLGGLNFLYPFPTLRNIWWLATICNLYLYDLHDATIDSSKTFPKKNKTIRFSPSFLEVSCGIRSPLPASFQHFSAGYKEATGIDLSVSAYVARKGQERKAIEGLAGRPGPKRQDRPVFFLDLTTGPTSSVDLSGDFELRTSWRSDFGSKF